MDNLLEAAKVWRNLAEQELELAKINARYGDITSYITRSNIYIKCAEALEIQAHTGIAVCSCCHKPLGEGMKHGGYFH